MYKRICLEGAIAVFPGIQRVLPVFVLPFVADQAVSASILQTLSLASVVVLITAIGFVNAIISEAHPERLIRLSKLYLIQLTILCVLTVIFIFQLIDFGDVYYYLILWTFLWGGYQLLRSYLIASNLKKGLVFLELTGLLALLTAISLYLMLGIQPFYIFIVGLIPFNVYFIYFLSTTYWKLNEKKSNHGFLKDSLVFGYANIASAAPMLLLPFLFGFTGSDHRVTVIVGLVVNVLSVSMLLNRAMSNHYLPKMLDSTNKRSLEIYFEFQKINKFSLMLVCPMLLAVVHFVFDQVYENIYNTADVILVFSCILAFFFSQLSLPKSNFIVVLKKGKDLATSNTVGLIVFSFVSMVSLFLGSSEKGILIALVSSTIVKYLTLKFFVNRIDHAR